MKSIKCYSALFVLLIGLIALAGCGSNVLEGIADDDSFEARLDDARTALDDEDYVDALDRLLDLQSDYPNNAEVKAYLSNAYAGLAGLDTFHLLEVLSDLDDLDNSGSIDMVGLTLGDAEGTLTAAMIEEKLSYFNSAVAALDDIAQPNDDQLVQRGLLGVFRVGLVLGQTIANDTGQDTVTLTEAGVKAAYAGQEAPAFDGDITDDELALISDDIAAVGDAVDALVDVGGEENDISEDFTEFKDDMDPNDDDWVSVEELENYVGDILQD